MKIDNHHIAISEIPSYDKANKAKTPDDSEQRIKRQKQEFFTLLTTQLKHQDPMSPMDTSDMTQQIFAINNVEQQLQANKHLEDIKKSFIQMQNTNSLHYIGKMVDVDGDKSQVIAGKGVFNYDILTKAESATIKIRDLNGNIVDTQKAEHSIGNHTFVWNKPAKLPDGIYRFSISAKDMSGNGAETKTYSTGRVESITTQNGEQYLEVLGSLVPLNKHYKTRSGSIMSDSLVGDINTKIGDIIAKLDMILSQKQQTSTTQNFMDNTQKITDPKVIEELTKHVKPLIDSNSE